MENPFTCDLGVRIGEHFADFRLICNVKVYDVTQSKKRMKMSNLDISVYFTLKRTIICG